VPTLLWCTGGSHFGECAYSLNDSKTGRRTSHRSSRMHPSSLRAIEHIRNELQRLITTYNVLIVRRNVVRKSWRSGVVESTLAFASIGHGIESEHRLFLHHDASASSKLRSLAKCSLDDSSSSTAVVHSASYPPGRANRVAAYQW